MWFFFYLQQVKHLLKYEVETHLLVGKNALILGYNFDVFLIRFSLI